MNKLLLILIFLFTCNLNSPNDKEMVFICTGSYSKCYHKTDKCEGLIYCAGQIKKVSKEDAINKHNRKPCKYCYGK